VSAIVKYVSIKCKNLAFDFDLYNTMPCSPPFQHIRPHHTTPHHTTPHHTTSHHITSHHSTPLHATLHHSTPFHWLLPIHERMHLYSECNTAWFLCCWEYFITEPSFLPGRRPIINRRKEKMVGVSCWKWEDMCRRERESKVKWEDKGEWEEKKGKIRKEMKWDEMRRVNERKVLDRQEKMRTRLVYSTHDKK
jgi:hypothetical protein